MSELLPWKQVNCEDPYSRRFFGAWVVENFKYWSSFLTQTVSADTSFLYAAILTFAQIATNLHIMQTCGGGGWFFFVESVQVRPVRRSQMIIFLSRARQHNLRNGHFVNSRLREIPSSYFWRREPREPTTVQQTQLSHLESGCWRSARHCSL